MMIMFANVTNITTMLNFCTGTRLLKEGMEEDGTNQHQSTRCTAHKIIIIIISIKKIDKVVTTNYKLKGIGYRIVNL